MADIPRPPFATAPPGTRWPLVMTKLRYAPNKCKSSRVRSQVDYGSYTAASVRLMIELANSYDLRRDPPEQLPDTVTVTEFLRRHRMLGPNKVGPRDVTELHELRA